MEYAFCMHCGQKIPATAQTCTQCGAQQTLAASSIPLQQTVAPSSANTLPEGIKGWSWGAFWLSWIWAIFNKTWIGLLALIPLVNIVMMVVLGLNGREWAWKNKTWSSVEHFNRVQKKWNLAGWIVIATMFILGIAAGVIEDHMKKQSGDFDTNWSLDEDADKKASGRQSQADTPLPQAASPYPAPRIGYAKTDLIAALRSTGVEPPWITHFTNYLGDPQGFWQECVANEASRAQLLGGMNAKAAQAHGESACQSLAQHHYTCINDKPMDDATLCLVTYINDVAENGD